MYISITKPERDTFLQQTTGCLMPGYTGHCPTLKFRIGKRYGASTQEIIREMGERGVWAKRMLESHYRQVDPLKGLLVGGDFRPIEKTKGQINPPAGRSKRYILGYTGFIPGMNFSYGKSYANLAEESFDKFNFQRRAALERKKVGDLSWRAKARGTQKLPETYPHDKLSAALLDYDEKNRYRDEHISPEQPPIAGYTGHIPRIKSSEASLSLRYHEAAKKGLYLLQQDRERLRTMEGISSVPYQTPVY
ncbi:ciliary microtubule inner protein 2B [Halyomorpha halys]|uniref:ciliary microtubule inner protein 2B n=1 Tax=Halyomorpha halys TaxID=286706 RepID=UPI0006D5192B|nr:protein FAM166B-like [Halyomorpha halys]